ncbi:MAG: hypothetical protein OXI15_25195 [Chromatiales bacterium]|nr:hypothetical protein [Chromatiales bacterium]
MVETNLTQADALTAMEKLRVNEKLSDFPADGAPVVMPFQSAARRDQFLVDRNHGRIDLRKVKIQNWEREAAVLAWLDVGGAPHRNPDGEEIPVP